MFYTLKRYYDYDPAATGYLEILLLYPGVKAVFFHRIAHALRKLKLPFFPRMVSEFSRFVTGIDIHPGATIGRGLIIDHGMGTVVGETTLIGDDVILYQGVTLGGTDTRRVKRHPTLENNVVVGAGAKVLGDIVIGSGSRIGANSVVIESLPPNTTAVGIPARTINRGIRAGEELSHQKIKD
jgi:serine O-acetyltransferase